VRQAEGADADRTERQMARSADAAGDDARQHVTAETASAPTSCVRRKSPVERSEQSSMNEIGNMVTRRNGANFCRQLLGGEPSRHRAGPVDRVFNSRDRRLQYEVSLRHGNKGAQIQEQELMLITHE